MVVDSPCFNVCELDANNVCKGCYRTLEEIGKWADVPDLERERILRLARARQAQVEHSYPQRD